MCYHTRMNQQQERIRGHSGVTFRYARGKSIRAGSEIHAYHEMLYYMGGGATFLSEHFQETLAEDTLLLIPKDTYHQFHIENQREYTRLVISFPDLPAANPLIGAAMTGIRVYAQLPEALTQLLGGMCGVLRMENASDEAAGTYLYGAFLMLLSQLQMSLPPESAPQLRGSDQLISRCIAYIDAHLAQELTVEGLARAMNVSVSTLAHCFARQLGVSVYRYVTEKRLIRASRLLRAGGKPMQVYPQCGYRDYPTFYKAYVRMFGHSPSSEGK